MEAKDDAARMERALDAIKRAGEDAVKPAATDESKTTTPVSPSKADRARQAELDAQKRATERLAAARATQQATATTGPIHPVSAEIGGLIKRFGGTLSRTRRGGQRGESGNVPVADVNAVLAKLASLPAPDLLKIAREVNADAGLSDKSPAAKIRKQITEMVNRAWKTSDNVNH